MKPDKQIYQWGLTLVLMIFFSLGCIIWDLVGYDISKDVYSGAYTAIARELTQLQRDYELEIAEKTEWADYNNAYATNQAATYQAIMSATPVPPTASVIENIEFLSAIIGDGKTNYGNLYFHDVNGDVNRLTLDVVSAANFGARTTTQDLIALRGDDYSGVFQLYIWYEDQQDVTLRATLYDEAGLKSNPMNFSFTCE